MLCDWFLLQTVQKSLIGSSRNVKKNTRVLKDINYFGILIRKSTYLSKIMYNKKN